MAHELTVDDNLSNWLSSLDASATNPATKQKVSGTWVELVKVKQWYSLRLMKWDATNKKKEYVKYIGTLQKAKASPVYGTEARRLEIRRFGVSGGAIIPDIGAYQPNAAEFVH